MSGVALVSLSGTSFKNMISGVYFYQSSGKARVRSLNLGNQNDQQNGGGVVYGNTFIDDGAGILSLSLFGSISTGKWDASSEWGSSRKWYIEDNTFKSTNTIVYEIFDAYRNAKFVFRYN